MSKPVPNLESEQIKPPANPTPAAGVVFKNVTNTRVERFTEMGSRGEGTPAAGGADVEIKGGVVVLADECGLCPDPVLSTEDYKTDTVYGLSHTQCLARDAAEVEPTLPLSEAEMVLQMVARSQGNGTDDVRHVHVAYLPEFNKQGSPWYKNKSTGAPRVTCNRISPLTLDYLEIVRRENSDLIDGKFGTFLFTAFGPQGKITDWTEDVAKPTIAPAPMSPPPAEVSRETPAELDGFIATATKMDAAMKVLGYARPAVGGEVPRPLGDGEGPRTRTALAEMLEILNVADALKKRFGDESEKDSETAGPVTITPGVPGESPWVKDAVAIGQATGLSEFMNGLGRQLSGPLVNLGVSWLNTKLNEKRAEAGKAAETNGQEPQLNAAPNGDAGNVSRETSPATDAAPPQGAMVDPNAMPFLMAIVEDLERAEPGECDVTKAVTICVQALQFAPEQSRPFFDELLRLSPIELVLWLSQQNGGSWKHLIKLRQAAEFCESWQNDLRDVLAALDGGGDEAGQENSPETIAGAPTDKVKD